MDIPIDFLQKQDWKDFQSYTAGQVFLNANLSNS